MFGRKRIAELETEVAVYVNQINTIDDELLISQTTIREMDQLIFNMSQCQSWDAMQPFFALLLQDTMRRKTEESERIQSVLLPEMRKAYSRGN